MGGLGNQLFQIFTTIAYAIKSQQTFKFYNIDILESSCTTRHTYWNSFLKNLKPFLTRNFPAMERIIEKKFTYTDIPIDDLTNKNVCLLGYFQSYKYFEEYTHTICKIIKLEDLRKQILDKSGYSSEQLANTISLHFRIGDYKKLQDDHPILKYSYYENALLYIQNSTVKEKIVLYFCEDSDLEDVMKIIEILKKKFYKYTFIRADNQLEDWEQMILMSSCRYNVIANSTFSWWAAYLNNHSKKVVLYPSAWFGPNKSHDTKDLFPSTFIRLSHI
jgi:hypothetical protein